MTVLPLDIAAMVSAALSAIALILGTVINARTRQTSQRLGQTNHGSGSVGESIDALRDETAHLQQHLAILSTNVESISRYLITVSDRIDANRRFDPSTIDTINQRLSAIDARTSPGATAPHGKRSNHTAEDTTR